MSHRNPDSQGAREVRRLGSGSHPAGRSVIQWDGRDAKGEAATRGIYFVRVRAAGQQRTVKLVLL